ncbi:unnamed protein product [Brassicogethes aeneus]|uniref:Uncharacterized protein n=1 Tax=Brassicogethes aeneus TaxID=1431903 RepID=A0A9P0BGX9_BRAAE|nr:unnamed protein product [Brassicogethes aeneus]
MSYGIPMIWSEPIYHESNRCYPCVNNVFGLNRINAAGYNYKDVSSAQIPLPHSDAVPIPPGGRFSSLRETWQDIKKNTKAKAAKSKAHAHQTGGGEPMKTDLDCKDLKVVHGLDNGEESTIVFHFDED